MSEDGTRDDEAEPVDLDDVANRSELRDRYYGLLQELRVVLPGVQVLLAVLFTVPFAAGFTRVGRADRQWFGGALVLATLSVIALMTPTVIHRFGDRTARAARLQLSIVATRIGLVLLACALLVSMAVVLGAVYSTVTTALFVGLAAVVLLALWVGGALVTLRRP